MNAENLELNEGPGRHVRVPAGPFFPPPKAEEVGLESRSSSNVFTA